MTAHTALQASQAHAAKTDDASPFSALLEAAAPKKDQGADKTKPKDKSASDDDARDTRAGTVKANSKTDAKSDAPAPPDKSDKADKSDKPEDTAKAADAGAADATQVAADAPAQPIAVPPAAIVVATAAAPDEANSDIEAVTGAPGPAAQADGNAAAAQDADPAGDGAADAAPAQDIKGMAKPVPRKPLQAAADAKASKPNDTASAKTEGAKADSVKADSAKPDAPQPDKIAAGDTAAPKPAPAANTNLAVHDITAAQAPQNNAPSVTQHVQVAAQTPTPAPNMPALAVEISAKSQSGAKQFDIRLDPPELGRVEVRLSIDAAGKASAHLSADQPQTLDLLQKDSTSLMRALRDAGLDVSQDGLNFSLRQQAQNQQDGGAQQGGGRAARNFALTATTTLEATATSAAYRRPADGRVDISV